MGKRSSFERRHRDFYPTPAHAVAPLLPHLPPGTRFAEPCCGDGALIRHLEAAGHRCVAASDIEPKMGGVDRRDVRELVELNGADAIVTNPPFLRAERDAVIDAAIRLDVPAWLLLPGDWLFNQQSAGQLRHVWELVAIGRVQWIDGTPHKSRENFVWLRFGPMPSPGGRIRVHPQLATR